MINPDIRDLLASFSPSSDYFSIASADGRVKLWDTLKGQLLKEYVEFESSSDESKILSESKRGHLSLDYKCMKWVRLERKKKNMLGSSLLVLGTGGGDVLAVEVSTGQLKWRLRDCCPGGVSAISCSRHCSYIHAAGFDGMVSQIDCLTGAVNRKFRSSTKKVSALAVSRDGNMLAVAAGQLRIFSCSENKKIQKFSGHPVSVRCIIFSEDGNYILSSGVGEKHIAIWRIDGGKKKSANCVLSMEHPAIFLDSRGSDVEGSKVQGLYVIALSEMGMCYFWYGSSIKELQNRWPTKILLSFESSTLNRNKNQAIFAAKLDRIVGPASALVHIAHGSLVKPSFEKFKVEFGVDLLLNTSQDGVLLPTNQSNISKKGEIVQAAVTTLDRANAEDAILPLPKLHVHEKKRKHGMPVPDSDFVTSKVDLVTSKSKNSHSPTEVQMQCMDVDETICIEERLREAGIIDGKPKAELEGSSDELTDTIMHECLDFTVDLNLPRRKVCLL
ncbi:hypothetical protein AXF42_Ash006130 [Apostasia shenzhenica]|uniref:Uncharacterized protein n=1 Tax=Apostasia shenzhenica TaxID=1088818 RepID=A0A2I0B0A2_9ASPA|nr:hypothetical protein AXF42_Ash006130 [Apostasia shenzhenica]